MIEKKLIDKQWREIFKAIFHKKKFQFLSLNK